MKERHELKVDIALNQMLKLLPGGHNLYIANSGQLREKNSQQRNHQNNLNANFQPILPRPPIRAHSNLQPNQHPFNPANPNPVPVPRTITTTSFQPNQYHFNPTNFNLQPRPNQATTTSFQPYQAPVSITDANLIQFNPSANLSNQALPPTSTSAPNVIQNPPLTNTFPTWSFPPPPLPTFPSISQPLGPPAVPSGFVFTGASQPLLAPVSGSHSTHVIPSASQPAVESDQSVSTNQQRAASDGSPGHQVSANQE